MQGSGNFGGQALMKLIIGAILVVSSLWALPMESQPVEKASASSVWFEGPDTGFRNGSMNNVAIGQSGNLMLVRDTLYVEDDFTDTSKISTRSGVVHNPGPKDLEP